MRTASDGELRQNLSSLLDSVTEDHTPVLITLDPGKSAVVLMSLEDFSTYEETRHLLGNPHNARRLLEATSALESGGGRARDLTE